MPALSIGELAIASGGTLLRGMPDRRVDSYSIDTRSLRPGGAFFALRGTRTDGHAFLTDAARAGATAAFVEREPETGQELPEALIRVDDVVAALSGCGALARRKIGAKFIAVTGSSGKTTVKELIAAGLAVDKQVHRTHGNQNNHLGVPLTLLACPRDADVAILELGMSAPGEIASLARMVDPDIALVANVGSAHMEFFRSLDDIAAAKGEMFAVLRKDAIAVVNLSDELVRVQSARHAGPRITYGRNPKADLVMESLKDRFLPGASLTVRHGERTLEIQLRLGGAHSAWNALAALAAVLAAGGDLNEAAKAMARVEPGPGRCKIHELPDGVVVVDDSYNSNPSALASVLETLRHSHPTGRKILVMGDMLELGPRESAYHREAGKKAAQVGVQILVGVGPRARTALDPARKGGVPETRHEESAASAARTLPGLVRPGDLFVIKGSRSVGLEKVVEALLSAKVETH